jgi:hypothetical protein
MSEDVTDYSKAVFSDMHLETVDGICVIATDIKQQDGTFIPVDVICGQTEENQFIPLAMIIDKRNYHILVPPNEAEEIEAGVELQAVEDEQPPHGTAEADGETTTE